MRMVNSAREVFGVLPPIPEGLDLGLRAYKQQEVEGWLRVEHGIMFLDAGDIGDEDDMIKDGSVDENAQVEVEEMGEVPEMFWDEKLGEPLMTPYELEHATPDTSEIPIEESHR